MHSAPTTPPDPDQSPGGRLPDAQTHQTLSAFRDRLAHRYRNRLRALVLFGSRARGDHREDSDADVAVFLVEVADPIAEQMDLAEDAYLLYLDLGIMTQPWVFLGSPGNPDPTRAARLLKVVRSEGIAVGALEVIGGKLPKRALSLPIEWAIEHRQELMEDWRLCQAKQLPKRISPLD